MAKIYIAGPMSGYPEFNFPAFYEAEDFWTECGYEVFNPARKDEESQLDPEAFKTGDHIKVQEKGFDFKSAYMWDLEHVVKADAIYMLKGWQYSPGAVGEHAVAVALKKHNPDYEIIYGE